MNFDDLKELNEKFSSEVAQFNTEFGDLFKKWLQKSPRMASIMIIHLPINSIMGALEDNLPLHEMFPELPEVFIRFLNPFLKLRDNWGRISAKEFYEQYTKVYESQFDAFFVDKETKENFKEWFEKENKDSQ
jgi:hypothetical protein